MKYLILMFFISFQALACKSNYMNLKDEACEKCELDLGHCMAKTINEVDNLMESEIRKQRNECRNLLQVCTLKNECMNKE